MFRNRLAVLSRTAVLGCGLLFAHSACADTIKLNFSSVFSGTAPAGSAPWLTATLRDISPGSVQLTILALNLPGQESVDGLYFNLNPLLNPAALTITRNGASTGPTAANTHINQAVDSFKADGDGFFDIFFQLPPPPGQMAARFTNGESLIYDISGPSTLSAVSFLFLSVNGGGPGPQLAAAHVQGIGSTGADSGWIGAQQATVPLPAAFGLFASGLGLLVRLRRQRA